MSEYDLTIISLGAGVQSSTLYRMAALGELTPMPDYAVFADTQSEPSWVYDTLDLLERDHGDKIPIIRATKGSLKKDLENGVNSTGQRFAAVPFWMEGKDGRYAPGRRQCTAEYKIEVVRKAVRDLLGLKKGERAAGNFRVEEWIGISLDEATRAKPSRHSWVTCRWPMLYDIPMRRSDCFDWLEAHGFPIPKKSACTFCPYRGAAEYGRMREADPEVFEEACQVDDMIRSTGTMKGFNNEQFVLNTLKPLRDLPPLEELEDQTLDMFEEECEGMCGV
jgi:hypothetical protein